MKNLYHLLAGGIVLSALVLGCTQDLVKPEADITSVRCSISQIDVEEDFATGIIDTLTATKASFSGTNFIWSLGDRIGIIPNTGSQIYFAVNDGAGTSTAAFDGGDWAMKSTGTFYAYYPLYPDIFLTKDHVSVSYTGQTQNGNNNNLHTGDFWTLYTEGTTAVGNALNFSFNHLTSFFKTYVTVPAGTYTKITFSAPNEVFIKDGYFDLGAQTPTIVGTTMTDILSLDLQNVTFADETELTGYLVLAPVDITGIPITVTVYKDGAAAYEYTLTKTSPMVPAKTYAFRATALTQLASSVSQANTLFASGATAVTITEPLTEDATIVLPNSAEAVTLILPTTASSSKLTVSYGPSASSYPTTLSITGPEGADLDIRTPSSTVTVNGIAYDQITSRTAANTCIIPAGVTVTTLKVIQGGVQVYGTVSQIDLSEQEDDAIINIFGTVTSLLGEDDEEYVPATGVSLNQSSTNLNVGATETLTATVAPVGAYPKVIWSSSDEAVATVSSTGVVTAVAAGSATITAKTISGGFTASCEVTAAELNYLNEPFTITSTGSTSVSIIKSGYPNDITLEYRKGTDSWASYTIGFVVDLSDGESLQFRAGVGGNNSFSMLTNTYQVSVTGEGTIDAAGNIMSLLDQTLETTSLPEECFVRLFWQCSKLTDASNLKLPATALAQYCYKEMFYGCTSLTAAPELPATTLAGACYGSMFTFCSGLSIAPELPATTLAGSCYGNMFENCTGLSAAPALPATTLESGCYNSMFSGCTGLSTAPELPATSLASDCYNNMFHGCTSLGTAPELPATSLADRCYQQMFSGCTVLSGAPALPATTLESSCYNSMFSGCTGLSTAPELPATTLASNCYYDMFFNCTGLSTAPELPATTLASGCYYRMFYNCTGLSTAPNLPAITLADECYRQMFQGCTGLSAAPVLPATTLRDYCYFRMFSGCTHLNYIKMLATDVSASSCLSNWVYTVAATGTFVKSSSATWTNTGSSGIPSGWTVQTAVPTPEAVDLGLSVKWASFNLGASTPEGFGDYYAWGEIEPYYIEGHSQDDDCTNWIEGKTGYNWGSYKWCNGTDNTLTKYNKSVSSGTVDNKYVLENEDDVAYVKLGGNWRMPTYDEWKELIDYCSWTWISMNGIYGFLVTASNANSIFLPATGIRVEGGLYSKGSDLHMMSSSLYEDDNRCSKHVCAYFDTSVHFNYGGINRCYGLTVRPICVE